MFIGINKEYRIKQIAETANGITNTSLEVVEIDREEVFGNWTDRRILAYCYETSESGGYAIYPARDLTQVELADNKEAIENGLLQLQADMVEAVIDEYCVLMGE